MTQFSLRQYLLYPSHSTFQTLDLRVWWHSGFARFKFIPRFNWTYTVINSA